MKYFIITYIAKDEISDSSPYYSAYPDSTIWEGYDEEKAHEIKRQILAGEYDLPPLPDDEVEFVIEFRFFDTGDEVFDDESVFFEACIDNGYKHF